MSREDMHERVEGPLDYKEFVTLVELAENIEERLDRYSRQLATLLLGTFAAINFISYSLVSNLSNSLDSESLLFGFQPVDIAVTALLLTTATIVPGAASTTALDR